MIRAVRIRKVLGNAHSLVLDPPPIGLRRIYTERTWDAANAHAIRLGTQHQMIIIDETGRSGPIEETERLLRLARDLDDLGDRIGG